MISIMELVLCAIASALVLLLFGMDSTRPGWSSGRDFTDAMIPLTGLATSAIVGICGLIIGVQVLKRRSTRGRMLVVLPAMAIAVAATIFALVFLAFALF